jgi:uncharacterized protein with PQ loop repeat
MKIHDYIGYFGLAFLQFNCIPAIIAALQQNQTTPISGVILSIIGLSCYLYNSVMTKNTLYTIGNIIGLVGNCILLLAILFK